MEKVVLITGATSGIGLATAHYLGEQGYTVILNGLFEDLGNKCVEDLKSKGIKADFYKFDVTDENLVNENLKKIGDKYHALEALINCAGGLGGRHSIEDMPTDFYRSVLALNLDSTFYITRAALPYLKKGINPSVINFTSIAAWNAGGPGASIYAAAKAAVTALTRGMAKEFAPYNIRCNMVSPGTIDTPFHQATKESNLALFESWKNGILMKRFGDPKEVATVIEFLISDKASFLTGEVIQINGGQQFI